VQSQSLIFMIAPYMIAVQTKRSVNAEDVAAMGTGPLFFLFRQKIFHAELLDRGKIFHHAHAIASPVSLVDMFDALAGIAFTLETKKGSAVDRLFTVPYLQRLRHSDSNRSLSRQPEQPFRFLL